MKKDKNILKGFNRFVGKPNTKKGYYVIIQVKEKKANGEVRIKEFIESTVNERIIAKNELYEKAKSYGGEVIYFGAFTNQ